ncbi:hypothetical protein Dsin_026957 [Dipteronia sinensis]|uniref:TF-B3 domain-containing protein n=1 Tax=Dipteronia sinensis TaxID=43782 RepID=A0AAE0DYC7_9ROSI|nr:hypothetical protein Dsin_026957 [Dipteronia sinensis]
MASSRRRAEPISSNPLAETPFHFFKVILPATLEEKKLRIPEKFVRKFGDELSDVASLRVPNGQVWHVRLTKDGKKIWFHVGWHDFVKFHSICVGYFLVFKYGKNSNFDVLIFDITAFEIRYPYYCGRGLKNDETNLGSKRCKVEELDEIKTSDAMGDESEFKKAVCKVEISSSDDENERIKFDELDLVAVLEHFGITVGYKFRYIPAEERERAITAVKLFKPKNPSFMVILRPDNLRKSRVDSDGSEWPVLTMWYGKCCYMRSLGGLLRKKNSDLGDICIFELIRMEDELKVSVFSASSTE